MPSELDILCHLGHMSEKNDVVDHSPTRVPSPSKTVPLLDLG